MRSRSRTTPVLTLAVLVSVVACSDRSPVEPAPAPAASLRFTYSGERSGMYQIQGEVPLTADGRPRHGTWAAALQVPGSDLSIAASRAGPAPLADVFLIALHNITAPGTYPLDPSCDHETVTSCALGMFAFAYDWTSSARLPDPYFMLESGTITITAIDARQVRGSFRVEGVRHPRGTGTITLSDGSFDVPIVHALSVRHNTVPLWSSLEAARSRGSSDPD